MFNSKIKERDLSIDYLRIETTTDTIIAKNRGEIISLFKDPGFKNKKADKKYALDNNRNLESIIVRQ